MSQDIANEKQNLSYTNLDFSSIYVEVLDMIKQLTKDWDPSISNESDPGVVLVKLSALLADKCNYNIDKSILEAFPLSVTQESNARQLYEQLGYYMNWYNAASTTVSLNWKTNTFDVENGEEYAYTIPKFTTVTNDNETVVYTLIGVEGESDVVVSDGTLYTDSTKQLNMIAYEGIPTSYTFNGQTTITPSMVDENNRLYFATSYVFENGVFINNVEQDNYSEWHRVNNLYEYSYDVHRYKFGYDSAANLCYIEFPDNYAELFGSGIEIVYLTFSTDEPYSDVPPQYLTKLLTDIPIQQGEAELNLSADVVHISNIYQATGHKDKESINDAYKNYKKTVATFNTLTTLRDYANYIRSKELDICSNAIVTDRTNDIQSTYQILSNKNGVESLVTEVEQNPDSVKFVKTLDEDIMSFKNYYVQDDNTKIFSPVPNDELNLENLSNYYELVGDDILSPFSLKCYLLNKSVAVTNRAAYDNTFTPISDRIDLNDLLEETSHLVHNFEDIEPLNKNIDFSYSYQQVLRAPNKTTSNLDIDYYAVPDISYYKKYDDNGSTSFVLCTEEDLTIPNSSLYSGYEDIGIDNIEPKDHYNGNIYYTRETVVDADGNTSYKFHKVDRVKLKAQGKSTVLEPGVYFSEYDAYTQEGVGPFAVGSCLTLDTEEYFVKVSVQMESKDDLLSKIIFLKSKFPLEMSVSTYSPLGYDTRNDVSTNIIKALYNNLDSSNLEFGTNVSQDYLKTIVLGADTRIKDVSFDVTVAPDMYAVFYDDDKGAFNEIKLPNTYTNISNGVEHYDEGSYITGHLSDILSNKIGKEIVCKSILKGVTQLLVPASAFNYHLNNQFMSEYDDVKYITGEAIIDLNNTDNYYTLIDSDSAAQKLTKSYTLKENETITLFKPAFTPVQDFTSGVHYDYVCYQGLLANQTYQLGPGEKFVFYVANADNSGNTISYTIYVYLEGSVISSTEPISPRNELSLDSLRSNVDANGASFTYYSYTETSIDKCARINNNTNISNTKIGTNATISIKEVNSFTVTEEDGYRFLWVLNRPIDNDGELTQYQLFGSFDPASTDNLEDEQSINSYTLKSGELLYYADKSLSKIGVLGAGTTITRTCGTASSDYTLPPTNNNYDRINSSGFTFVNIDDVKNLGIGSGFKGIKTNDDINPNELGFYELAGEDSYKRTSDTSKVTDKQYFILIMKDTSGWYVNAGYTDKYGNQVRYKASDLTTDVFTPVNYLDTGFIYEETENHRYSVIDDDGVTSKTVYEDVNPSKLGLYEQVVVGNGAVYDSYRLANKFCDTSEEYISGDYKPGVSAHIRYTDTEDTSMFESNFLSDELSDNLMDTSKPSTFRTFEIDEVDKYNPTKNKYLYKESEDTNSLVLDEMNSSVFIPAHTSDDYNEELNYIDEYGKQQGRYFYKDRRSDSIYHFVDTVSSGIPLTAAQVDTVANAYVESTKNTTDVLDLINDTNNEAAAALPLDDFVSEFKLNVFTNTDSTISNAGALGASAEEAANLYVELSESDLEESDGNTLDLISDDIHIGYKDYFAVCNDMTWNEDKDYLRYTSNDSSLPDKTYAYQSTGVGGVDGIISPPDLSIYVPSTSEVGQPGVTYYSVPKVFQKTTNSDGNYKELSPAYIRDTDRQVEYTPQKSVDNFVNDNYLNTVSGATASNTFVKINKKIVEPEHVVSSEYTYYVPIIKNGIEQLQQVSYTQVPGFDDTYTIYRSVTEDEVMYKTIQDASDVKVSTCESDLYINISGQLVIQLHLYYYDAHPGYRSVTGQILLDYGFIQNDESTGYKILPQYQNIIYSAPGGTLTPTTDVIGLSDIYYVIYQAEEVLDGTGNLKYLDSIEIPKQQELTVSGVFESATALIPDSYYYKKNDSNSYELDFYYDEDENAYTYDGDAFKLNNSKLATPKSKLAVVGKDEFGNDASVPKVGDQTTELYYVDAKLSPKQDKLSSDYLVDTAGNKYKSYVAGETGSSSGEEFKPFKRTITKVTTLDGGTAEVQLTYPASNYAYFSFDNIFERHLKGLQTGEGILYCNDAECSFNIPRTTRGDIKYTKTTKNNKAVYSLNFDAYFRYKKNTVSKTYGDDARDYVYARNSDGSFSIKYIAMDYYLPKEYTFPSDAPASLAGKKCQLGGYELVQPGELAEAGVKYYYTFSDVDYNASGILNNYIKIDQNKVTSFAVGEPINSQGGSGGRFVFKKRRLDSYFFKRTLSGSGSDEDTCLKNVIANFKKVMLKSENEYLYRKIKVPVRYYQWKKLASTGLPGLHIVQSYDYSELPAAPYNHKMDSCNFGFYTSEEFPISDYYTYSYGPDDTINPKELGYFEKKYAESPFEWNTYQVSYLDKFYSSNKDLSCFVPLISDALTTSLISGDTPLYKIKTIADSEDNLGSQYISYPLRYTSLPVPVKQSSSNVVYQPGDDLSNLLYETRPSNKQVVYKYDSLALLNAVTDDVVFSYGNTDSISYAKFEHTFEQNMQSLLSILDMLNAYFTDYSTYIMYKPNWYTLGRYYRTRQDKAYYKPLRYEVKTFNAIPEWICTAEAADKIAENPKLKLNEIFTRLQPNTEVTFTKNQLWTLSQGDIITASTEAQYVESNLFPVFSNSEINLDLDMYDIAYQRVGNEFEDIEKITIPGYGWRGYSNLQLNCVGTNGQHLATNHTLSIYDNTYDGKSDDAYKAIISNNEKQHNVHFQLEYPVENKTGSFIDVSTYSQTQDELLNSIYVYNVIDSKDRYNFTSDHNTYVYFKKLEDDVFYSTVELQDIKLSAGEYLIPINGVSDGKVRCTYKYLYTKKYISSFAELVDGDEFVYRYDDGGNATDVVVKATLDTDSNTLKLMSGNISIVDDVAVLDDSDWAYQFDSIESDNKLYLINSTPLSSNDTSINVVSYIDTNKDYFLGDKTHFGYIEIPEEPPVIESDSDDEDKYELTSESLVFTLTSKSDTNYVPQDDIVYIIVNDLFKFRENPDLSYSIDEIKTKIQQLDIHSIYNYVHQPKDNDLIKDPLEPKAYWDKNHPYNPFTIAQLNADKINIKYIS